MFTRSTHRVEYAEDDDFFTEWTEEPTPNFEPPSELAQFLQLVIGLLVLLALALAAYRFA